MQPAPTRARRTAFIAVLALLLAQALGLAHGVVHPRAANALLLAQQASGADSYAQHDEGSAQCRLLEQLTHADLLVPPLLGVPLAVPSQPCAAALRAAAPRLTVWRLRARGPPTFLA